LVDQLTDRPAVRGYEQFVLRRHAI